MASIQRRVSAKGVESWRVGYRLDSKLCWTPALSTPEGAVEMQDLIERLGPEVALGVLATRTGRRTDTGTPLLREWFARYQELRSASVTPGTLDDDTKMAARTWMPRLGHYPLDVITREMVIDWVAWQRQQPTARSQVAQARAVAYHQDPPAVETYSNKSIKNAHGLLSTVLAAAVEHDRGIAVNVAHGVKLPKDDAASEMVVFTRPEWDAFIAAMQPHYVPLTRFLLETGMRIGEATALKVSHLDLTVVPGLTKATVQVQRAWKKGGGKDAGGTRYLGSVKGRRTRRTLLLSPSMAAELAVLTAGKGPDDLVFTGEAGGRVQAQHYNNRQWAAALSRAGITKALTPHCLRHTSATWLLQAGVSPIVVQHRLGHESLATTSKVYAHLLTEEQSGAVAVMDAALSGPASTDVALTAAALGHHSPAETGLVYGRQA